MLFSFKKFNRRSILLSMILVTQLVCLLGAIFVFDYWISRQFVDIVQQRIKRNSNKMADELTKAIGLMNYPSIDPGTEGRENLVDMVHSMDVPGVSYTAIYLKDKQTLIGLNEAEMTQKQIDEVYAIARDFSDGQKVIEEHPDFVIAIRPLPQYDASLVVFQDDRYIEQRVDLIADNIKVIGMVVTVLVITISAFFTLLIFSRYEHELDVINTNLERKVQERTRALLRSHDAVIFGLAKLAESRDDQTGQHLERICLYVKVLAREFMDEHGKVFGLELDEFANTAALHDIGKVAVPDSILLKPGKLTKAERQIIEQHAGIGGDTLMAIKHKWGDDPFLITASQIAYAHHEKWDGTGYPFGLEKDQIPLPARIVSIADVYDALRTQRPYKPVVAHEEAVSYIHSQSGTQFDPDLVKLFLKHEQEFKRISETVQDDVES